MEFGEGIYNYNSEERFDSPYESEFKPRPSPAFDQPAFDQPEFDQAPYDGYDDIFDDAAVRLQTKEKKRPSREIPRSSTATGRMMDFSLLRDHEINSFDTGHVTTKTTSRSSAMARQVARGPVAAGQVVRGPVMAGQVVRGPVMAGQKDYVVQRQYEDPITIFRNPQKMLPQAFMSARSNYPCLRTNPNFKIGESTFLSRDPVVVSRLEHMEFQCNQLHSK